MISAFGNVCLCVSCGRLLKLTRPLGVPSHATLKLCQCVHVFVFMYVPTELGKHRKYVCVCLCSVCVCVCNRVDRVGSRPLLPCHYASVA